MRLALAAAIVVLSLSAEAQAPIKAPAARPVVVELFTSQSCSSCPPAEALFRDLAKRPDLIVLEWHVDYWDSLQVSGAGRWKDPYSNSAWTARQRDYARSITNGGNVYTPQAIIAGASETTGFNKGPIEQLIAKAAAKAAIVSIEATRGSDIRFALGAPPKGAEAVLVTFRIDQTTVVKGGENNGRTLSSSHPVIGLKKLGAGPAFTVPLPAQNESCALIVHAKNQGPVLGAAYCPR